MAGNSVSPRATGTNQFVAVYDWDTLLPAIVERMGQGEAMHIIATEPGMPSKGAIMWALYQRPELYARYQETRIARAELYSDMADRWLARLDPDALGDTAPKDVLDAMKAIQVRMAQLSPEYRERRVEHHGNVGHQHTHALVGERLVRARAKAIERSPAPMTIEAKAVKPT
jgi:hypothetical protein